MKNTPTLLLCSKGGDSCCTEKQSSNLNPNFTPYDL